MKFKINLFNWIAYVALGLALVACGKQEETTDADIADAELVEHVDSENGVYTAAATTTNPALSGVNVEQIKAKVKTFAAEAKVGLQACQADLRKSQPKPANKPANVQEAKSRLQSILSFFKSSTTLSPECQQFVTKLKGFREKLASLKNSRISQ